MNEVTRSQLWEIYDQVPIPAKLEGESGGIQYVNWMDTFVIARQPNKSTTLEISWEYITDDAGNDAWFFPNGTAEVKIYIHVSGVTHQASLPVMNSKHEAIHSPNATDINKSKMRVRCKALGELGLFWRLWSEDYHVSKPSSNVSKPSSNVVSLVPANDEPAVELTDSQKARSFLKGAMDAAKKKPPLTIHGLDSKIEELSNGLRTRGLVDKNFKKRMVAFRQKMIVIMEDSQ